MPHTRAARGHLRGGSDSATGSGGVSDGELEQRIAALVGRTTAFRIPRRYNSEIDAHVPVAVQGLPSLATMLVGNARDFTTFAGAD